MSQNWISSSALPGEEPQGALSSQTMSISEPPPLHTGTPLRKRHIKLIAGLILVTLDLCALPITYFYALTYDTNLSTQDIFAVITGVYGMLSFTHYFFRSLKLFRSSTAPRYRPVGWTKWGTAKFLEVNILIVIGMVKIELVAGTSPNNPIMRLCAMPSPTICYYLGMLFLSTAIFTQLRWKLPFNMSSTPKGSPWRPALIAIIEDAGAIEVDGGVEYWRAVMRRYEVSARFRRMILWLSWMWGLGFLGFAIVAIVLIIELPEHVGLGAGWGVPFGLSALWTVLTLIFVKRELRKEKVEWGEKEASSVERVPTLINVT